MQYLVVFQTKQTFVDDGPPADFTEAHAAEQAQGRALYGSADLRQSWEIDDVRPGAVCLFEAQSREDLQQMLDTFALVQKDYVDLLVIKLKPDTAYTPKL